MKYSNVNLIEDCRFNYNKLELLINNKWYDEKEFESEQLDKWLHEYGQKCLQRNNKK